ncbi:MAG: glycosyltransferase family 4 protein [Acidobacteriota bacterium]
MLEICIFSAVFLLTYFGVGRFRAWTLKRGVLDLPNERSSHVQPTPRGGGFVLAVVTLSVYVGASFVDGYEVSIGFALGALLVLIVSWLDDIYTISFAWRLAVHSVAAALVIYSCGHLTTISTPYGPDALNIGWIGTAITFCWIVWMINAYNFMDGIDGIAGLQAVTASIGWAFIGFGLNIPSVYVLGGAMLFASTAFLLHNWPPARIFMGDAGSAYLGFVFASIPFVAAADNSKATQTLFIASIALLWPFVFDAVFTIVRRAVRGERVWQAHREHLYQRLVRSGSSHRSVTLLYGGLSAAIAIPTTYSVISGSQAAAVAAFAVVTASAVLIVLICWKRKCLIGCVE